MANPRTLRTGLANRLRTIQGWAVYERWPAQVSGRSLIVDLVGGEPEQTMGRGELTRWDFEIEALVPLAGGWENAQDQLDPLLATSSTGGVFGAIAGDRTLGGRAHSTFVRALPRDYERRIVDEILEFMAATVSAEVWAS